MNKNFFTSLTAAFLSSAVFFYALSGCSTSDESLTNTPFATDESTSFCDPPQKSPEECFKNTFFLGDSNTAHLAHPGYTAIFGLVSPERIWTGRANTLMLDIGMSVFDPEAQKEKTIRQIAKEKAPEYLVITLGYNGFAAPTSDERKASLDKLFCNAYEALISEISKASPTTRIIIQSIFPVTSGTAVKDPVSVNNRIDDLNSLLSVIASKSGVKYLDTQSVLRDPKTNCLRDEYSKSGGFYHADGYHLSDTGLSAVLNYIKENAYE